MTAGQVPETIMTGNTTDISHISEFGWYDWVMYRDNEPSFPDDKLILGRYLEPAIDTGSALMAKILKSNSVFVCRSTLHYLTDEELNSSVHKDMRCKFDELIEHHLGPAALPQDFPAEDLTPEPIMMTLVATYVSLPRGMPRRQPTGMFLGPLALA